MRPLSNEELKTLHAGGGQLVQTPLGSGQARLPDLPPLPPPPPPPQPSPVHRWERIINPFTGEIIEGWF